MKSRLIFIEILVLIGVMMSGCVSKVKTDNIVLNDFIEHEKDKYGFINFDEITIEKRKTDKSNKSDDVYCTIAGESVYARHKYDVVLHYNFYEQGGWILDEIEYQNESVEILNYPDENDILQKFIDNPNENLPGEFSLISVKLSNIEPNNIEDGFESIHECCYVIDFSLEGEKGVWSYLADGKIYFNYNYNSTYGEWSEASVNYEFTDQTLYGLEGAWWQSQAGTTSICQFQKQSNIYWAQVIVYDIMRGNEVAKSDVKADIDVLKGEVNLPVSYGEESFGWDSGTYWRFEIDWNNTVINLVDGDKSWRFTPYKR